MSLTKKSFNQFSKDSPEYVIAHARWRKSRGHNPSMPYNGISNPRLALEAAKADVSQQAMPWQPIRINCWGPELINRYCSAPGISMSARPEYYSGYGVRTDCLGPRHLEAIYNGLLKDYGAEAAQRFCQMLEDLTDMSPTNFLNQFYKLVMNQFVWHGAGKEDNIDVGPDFGDGNREAAAFGTILTSLTSPRNPGLERRLSESLKSTFFQKVGYQPANPYKPNRTMLGSPGDFYEW